VDLRGVSPLQCSSGAMDNYLSSAKRPRLDDGPPETEILRLVAQRESCRQARRFAESDAIREELRTMGVELYDKEKEWRCRDGRRGVLFTAGPQECMFTDQEIVERINDREQARKSKEWERADIIRDELRRAGVELDDKEMCWRTASGRMGTYAGNRPRPLAGVTIRKLVAERERLRANQDYDAADDLRKQLLSLGVELFDNERLWRTADGQQGVIITGGHEVDCKLTNSEIATRVTEREAARSQKNWAQADAIREELRRQGAELLDHQRVWCTTDGRHASYSGGPNPHFPGGTMSDTTSLVNALSSIAAMVQQPQRQQTPQMRPPLSAPLSQNRTPSAAPAASTQSGTSFSDASINAMVTGREHARERHDWAAADAIRADLRSHGVEVWDKEKTWRANDGRSGTIPRPL